MTTALPPEGMLAGATETVDRAKLTAPGVTNTDGAVDVTLCELMVAVTVLLPASAPVKVAEYVPS